VFDLDTFVADCVAARAGSDSMLAVKDILERVMAQPGAVAAAVQAGAGVEVLHRSDDLVIASVIVPAGLPATLPHDHRMWALVGVYGGQEDNRFFRRNGGRLAESGGRSLHAGDTLAMGDDTIHAICNPLGHESLAAIHVYGGDLLAADRSMWTDDGEAPYDDTVVIGGGGIRQ
jgi:predicted metal-dependent enzyme (double-stranded beta helix superfamily)